MMKYLHVAQITWKSMLAYQADTWLDAGFMGFRVLLAFLLWSAVFAGRSEVGGYTLGMMVTYMLISSLLGSLQNQDALAWQLSSEIREGQFSKYLVRPVSVSGYFIGAWLGRWTYMLLVDGVALLAWGLIFSKNMALSLANLDGGKIVWLLLLIPLGGLCMLLFNHCIGLLSLKYLDVTGIMILKGTFIGFLSGGFLPLNLLPAPFETLLRFTPFYYMVYYPASLFLGKQSEPPLVALLVLSVWCLVFWTAAEAWFSHARKYYEGVGI